MHDYANAVIQGRAYRPDEEETPPEKTEKGDLGVEVARLNYAIDDVTRQLRQEVSYSLYLELTQDNDVLSVTAEPPDDVAGAVIAAVADPHIPDIAFFEYRPVALEDPRAA